MTTASRVARLPEEVGRRPWRVWISFATPCTGIFIPVYLDGVIPGRLASPESWGAKGELSAWEAMRTLQGCATEDFDRSLPMLRSRWAECEREIERDRQGAEQDATWLYEAERFDDAEQVLSRFMEQTTDRVVEVAVALTRSI